MAVLVGPTAVGKTAVAVAVAQSLGAEIINADSLQVYRELDIGTAKPTAAERALAPHHLVDIVNPDEPYDAARYVREAQQVISELAARDVPPLVVGGTGLYIKALLQGLFVEGAARPAIRLAHDCTISQHAGCPSNGSLHDSADPGRPGHEEPFQR